MKILLKLKTFLILLNFEKRYLYYIGLEIGIQEKLKGNKLNEHELYYHINRYLAMGIIRGYNEVNQ